MTYDIILSNTPQVVPPPTYLKRVYETIRKNGGVCIADEVQTGFARTGTHYWCFQHHDVLPDMVTIGEYEVVMVGSSCRTIMYIHAHTPSTSTYSFTHITYTNYICNLSCRQAHGQRLPRRCCGMPEKSGAQVRRVR